MAEEKTKDAGNDKEEASCCSCCHDCAGCKGDDDSDDNSDEDGEDDDSEEGDSWECENCGEEFELFEEQQKELDDEGSVAVECPYCKELAVCEYEEETDANNQNSEGGLK